MNTNEAVAMDRKGKERRGEPAVQPEPKADATVADQRAADRAARVASIQAMREAAIRANEAEMERRTIMARWLGDNPAKVAESPVQTSELYQLKAELRIMLADTDSAAALERLIEILEGESKEFALSSSRYEKLYLGLLDATANLFERIKARDAALEQAALELQEAKQASPAAPST